MYYVYTLAYPDGTIFYVGKGQGDRINHHEMDARRIFPVNPAKAAIIREILDSGAEVVKTIVAEFESEQDAYLMEWGIICMHARADQFTNIHRGVQAPHPRRKREWHSMPKLPSTQWQLDIFRYHEYVPYDRIP